MEYSYRKSTHTISPIEVFANNPLPTLLIQLLLTALVGRSSTSCYHSQLFFHLRIVSQTKTIYYEKAQNWLNRNRIDHRGSSSVWRDEVYDLLLRTTDTNYKQLFYCCIFFARFRLRRWYTSAVCMYVFYKWRIYSGPSSCKFSLHDTYILRRLIIIFRFVPNQLTVFRSGEMDKHTSGHWEAKLSPHQQFSFL